MNERQYSTMLSVLILPPLVTQIGRQMGLDEATATERLKLWHYSPVMLADMFAEAERTGTIPYPEES